MSKQFSLYLSQYVGLLWYAENPFSIGLTIHAWQFCIGT